MIKPITTTIIVIIVVGILSFYGGTLYGQSGKQNTGGPGSRQGQFQQFGGTGVPNGQRSMMANGGFTSGEILSKDDKSITVKLRDGGSKIVFFSDTTKVTKSADGSTKDLSVGQEVTTTGTANSDGSMTAESIQIRPATPPNAAPANPVPQSSGTGT